ncbi:MAG: recombinase family protein [Rhodobacteraceae bacterium]|nr:recombinase family protein [Paracoccaceae bacterium]
MSERRAIRCAIYTRKSSEEGLDQSFNSLDAQHEACAAYIASQRHEGWRLLPERYDDGGLSGGTLERPALQRLLAAIAAGRIDMIVVYKIDRLTRALTDFAKLVERFEAARCSFVSVTQAFNTSTSMGRLTLNVLLSFAQFEREVTAERIRDKIAASKRKGLWMGGLTPLGYDADPDPSIRGLVVNPAEAETVRRLFALYDDLGCLRKVEDEADRLGFRSKLRHFSTGRSRGGARLTRGMIHHLLTNPVYLGRIRHKDRVWPGRHAAIVDEALWERVQAKLQAAAVRARGRSRTSTGTASNSARAPLTGKLRDETGDRLTPSHTNRKGRRLCYYVSHRLLKGPEAVKSSPTRGWRLPAVALEGTIARLLADHLETVAAGHHLLDRPDVENAATLCSAADALVTELRTGAPAALGALLTTGRIGTGTISLTLDRRALAEALGIAPDRLAAAALIIEAPFQRRRRGIETRIVAGGRAAAPDPTLRRALIEAHRWATALRAGTQIAEIARREDCSESWVRRHVILASLSPSLQTAILDGTQPPDLSLKRLQREGIPLDWAEQARRFGLAG